MQILLSLLIALIGSGSANSQEASFEVKKVEGQVEVRVAGRPSATLQKGHQVGKGTQLRGSKDAWVSLMGSDGSRIKLEGESVLEILEYGKIREFRLDRGMAIFQAAPGAAGSFKVRTRAAVMGVRGTQFFVSYGRSAGDEWMCVREGEVEVASLKNDQSLVLVRAGQGVQIEANGSISKPAKLEWTEKLNWDMEAMAAKNSEDLLKQNYDDIRVRNYD
jgi:ferric-dicitrate binding protein FerR (iron transport regulator)